MNILNTRYVSLISLGGAVLMPLLNVRRAIRVIRDFSLSLAACLLLPAAASAIEPGSMAQLGSSVFRIQAADIHGRLHSGSGVMVAPHTLVTNCHVVLRARKITVVTTAAPMPARVVRSHADRDLCLLDTPGLEGAAVTIGKTMDKQAGEAITAIGYAPGAALSMSRGTIEGLYTYQGDGRVVQGSAFFDPGKSGGGLFDSAGQLIGILTFKLRAGGPYHFAVPAEWVVALLHDVSGAAQTSTGKPFWQHTGEQQPVFVRVASLSAEGNCAAVNTLTSQRLAREPGNPEALFMAERAQRCNAGGPIARPLLEKVITALLRD